MRTECTPAKPAANYTGRVTALTGAKQAYGGRYLLTVGRKQFLKSQKGGQGGSTHSGFACSRGDLVHRGGLEFLFSNSRLLDMIRPSGSALRRV